MKSISKEEAWFWCGPAKRSCNKSRATAYADHLENNDQTYLTKVYGVYSLRIYGTVFYIMLMNNTFYTADRIEIHEKYDLKGSSVNRSAKKPLPGQEVTCRYCFQRYEYERRRHTPCESGSRFHEPLLVFKDNDLKYRLRLGEPNAGAFMDQITADTEFLCQEFGTMDYSLLVGVHNEIAVVPWNPNWGTCVVAQSMEGPACYYISIIDMLQEWTLQKQVERYCKILWYGSLAASGVSAQEPFKYRTRFVTEIRRYTNFGSAGVGRSEVVDRKASMGVFSPNSHISVDRIYFDSVQHRPSATEDDDNGNGEKALLRSSSSVVHPATSSGVDPISN